MSGHGEAERRGRATPPSPRKRGGQTATPPATRAPSPARAQAPASGEAGPDMRVWVNAGWAVLAVIIAVVAMVFDSDRAGGAYTRTALHDGVSAASAAASAADGADLAGAANGGGDGVGGAGSARLPLAWVDWFASREDVGTVDWTALGETPMDAIAAAGLPVRIVHSPVDTWPALRRWSPAYFSGKLAQRRELPEVIVSPTPQIVYYDNAKPMKEVPGLPLRLPQHERRAVPVTAFFASIANGSDPLYMYWVGQRQRRNLYKWMEQDLVPTAPFGVHDRSAADANANADDGGAGVQMQTWVGKSGLTSVVHYDASHNVYAQLYGEKTFVIFPPAAAPLFQICPFQHPGDGHSCLDWERIEADAMAVAHARILNVKPAPEAAAAAAAAAAAEAAVRPPPGWSEQAARVVRLRAGDVLYLPPYWLHHVVTTGDGEAMSVSLISKSAAQQLMREIEAYPLRFEHAWPRGARIRAVVSLFHALLDTLGLRATAGPAQVLNARYAAWLDASAARKAAKALVRDFSCEAPPADVEAIAAAAGRAIGGVYAKLADSPGVQHLLLFNYLEAMAHWAVKDDQLIPVFLRLMARQCP